MSQINKFFDKCPYCGCSLYHEDEDNKVVLDTDRYKDKQIVSLKSKYQCNNCYRKFDVTWLNPIVKYEKEEPAAVKVPKKVYKLITKVLMIEDGDKDEPPREYHDYRTLGFFSTHEKADEVRKMLHYKYERPAFIYYVDPKREEEFRPEELDKWGKEVSTYYLKDDIVYVLVNKEWNTVYYHDYPPREYQLDKVLPRALYSRKDYAEDSRRSTEQNAGFPLVVKPAKILKLVDNNNYASIEIIENDIFE